MTKTRMTTTTIKSKIYGHKCEAKKQCDCQGHLGINHFEEFMMAGVRITTMMRTILIVKEMSKSILSG